MTRSPQKGRSIKFPDDDDDDNDAESRKHIYNLPPPDDDSIARVAFEKSRRKGVVADAEDHRLDERAQREQVDSAPEYDQQLNNIFADIAREIQQQYVSSYNITNLLDQLPLHRK